MSTEDDTDERVALREAYNAYLDARLRSRSAFLRVKPVKMAYDEALVVAAEASRASDTAQRSFDTALEKFVGATAGCEASE